MDLLTLLSTIYSWAEKLLKAVIYLFPKTKQGFINRYKKKYEKGMQIITENQDEVAKILFNYYSSGDIKHENLHAIRYLFQDGHSQNLALITKPNFILTTNPEFKIESSYSGAVNHFSLPSSKLSKLQKKWESLGIVAYEGHKYSLHHFNDIGTLDFRDTTFHTYRATFGEIYDELAITVASKGLEKLKNRKKLESWLPLRTKYLGSVDAIMDLHKRICAGGAITMFATRTNDDVVLVAQKRSSSVSDEQNTLTLVPRSFHEALISPRHEFDLSKTVYRECYEELFGGEIDIGEHIEPDFYVTENLGIRELVEGQNKNHILKPIALIWDLFRGNFIVAYCLYVHDPSWWDNYGKSMTLNWEYSKKEKIMAIRATPSEIFQLINRKDWAQDSYFAFVEAIRWLANQEPLLESVKSHLPRLILNKI